MIAKVIAVLAAVGVLIAAVVFLFSNRGSSGISFLPGIPDEPAVCPLSGNKPSRDALLQRPAVAVKVENNPAAYPLSGLQKAEVVYEELVEGGITRFMALYQCADAKQVGPVRSARIVDPAIMMPATKILADAGANGIVRKALADRGIVSIDEKSAGDAMRRIPRPGQSFEHTLYGNTAALRRLGAEQYDQPPPSDMFHFGPLPPGAKKANHVRLSFSNADTIQYDWSGRKWLRSDFGAPLTMENGGQIAVDNVLVEKHLVNFSKRLTDVVGAPSTVIADATGSGEAFLFRNGRVIVGTWVRSSTDESVVFKKRSGAEMPLARGKTWIELVPNKKGDVKGWVSYTK